MSRKPGVPDAWEDDYETVVHEQTTPDPIPAQVPKATRAERKAKHAEANKQLWQSAENPETFHFVTARDNVPLQTGFKPAMRVLSRKPQPLLASRANVGKGMNGVSLHADEDDSEEEARKDREQSLAERQRKARQEREEKQRKYAEVRQRLFGSPDHASNASSGRSSPMREPAKTRSRGMRGNKEASRDSNSASSADQSPARPLSPVRQLYDPAYTVKPNSAFLQRREAGASPSGLDLGKESRPLREPKGPDGSGRGGFGFEPRGSGTKIT